MTAQEWLDELERLRKAATPGPYILDGMYPIYSLGRGGLKDKTVACANSKFDGDYIVAACNSVLRLVEMLRLAVGFLDAVSEYRRSNGESVPDIDVMQLLFTKTEPKE